MVATVAVFVFFWLMVGLIWGGLMAYGIHFQMVKTGLADAVCAAIGMAIVSTCFGWDIDFSQHIAGLFVVVPTAKLFQDFILYKLGYRRNTFRR